MVSRFFPPIRRYRRTVSAKISTRDLPNRFRSVLEKSVFQKLDESRRKKLEKNVENAFSTGSVKISQKKQESRAIVKNVAMSLPGLTAMVKHDNHAMIWYDHGKIMSWSP